MNVLSGTGSNVVKQQTFSFAMEKTTPWLWGALSLISSHITARGRVKLFSPPCECACCAKSKHTPSIAMQNVSVLAFIVKPCDRVYKGILVFKNNGYQGILEKTRKEVYGNLSR
jgi:hypothetical protein